MLRHMLIHERGDELHLLAGAPDEWLAPGQRITVARAPTHFGPMELRCEGAPAGVKVEVDLPKRNPPKRVVLHLPKSRPAVNLPAGVELCVRPDQARHWDYATVVRLYKEQTAGGAKPIEGLVELPITAAAGAPGAKFTSIDLAKAANTDPYTAPFGVKNPGRNLFTGLKPGRQTAGGVPFDIVDAAKNAGRGLIVLHSPHAPQDRTWPTQVELPVGRQGKRMYFLGNVHGWAPADEGVPPLGAIAQYEIIYADGQKQVVPLVPGRTTDDWVSTPEADDAIVGIKGDPWHLNVLGVTLRAVPVAKIIFRDLGTPSAPLLAAVTIEQ
jgi:hypothetical protein